DLADAAHLQGRRHGADGVEGQGLTSRARIRKQSLAFGLINVRLYPIATEMRTCWRSASCQSLPYAPQQIASLFNYFVGERHQAVWNVEADRLCSREIDYQVELGCLEDRQIGGPLSFENSASIDAALT